MRVARGLLVEQGREGARDLRGRAGRGGCARGHAGQRRADADADVVRPGEEPQVARGGRARSGPPSPTSPRANHPAAIMSRAGGVGRRGTSAGPGCPRRPRPPRSRRSRRGPPDVRTRAGGVDRDHALGHVARARRDRAPQQPGVELAPRGDGHRLVEARPRRTRRHRIRSGSDRASEPAAGSSAGAAGSSRSALRGEPAAARLLARVGGVEHDGSGAVRGRGAAAASAPAGPAPTIATFIDWTSLARGRGLAAATTSSGVGGGRADLADHDAGGAGSRAAAASGSAAPAQRARPRVAITVSPAPVTSKTSRAAVGMWSGRLARLEEAHAVLAAGDEGGRAAEQASGSSRRRRGRPPRTRMRRPVACSASPWFGVTRVTPR